MYSSVTIKLDAGSNSLWNTVITVIVTVTAHPRCSTLEMARGMGMGMGKAIGKAMESEGKTGKETRPQMDCRSDSIYSSTRSYI
jgi:hypothetical protein